MARIGAFGSLVFEVSNFKILTFDEYGRKTGHNFAEHKIFRGKSKLESIGVSPQEISLEVLFHAGLGTNPENELSKIRKMVEDAQENFLIIGGAVIGQFVIEEMDEEVLQWSGVGTPLIVRAKLRLKEYL